MVGPTIGAPTSRSLVQLMAAAHGGVVMAEDDSANVASVVRWIVLQRGQPVTCDAGASAHVHAGWSAVPL